MKNQNIILSHSQRQAHKLRLNVSRYVIVVSVCGVILAAAGAITYANMSYRSTTSNTSESTINKLENPTEGTATTTNASGNQESADTSITTPQSDSPNTTTSSNSSTAQSTTKTTNTSQTSQGQSNNNNNNSSSLTVLSPQTLSSQSGNVFDGVKISNPNGNCIKITNSSNITIKNSTLGPCSDNAVDVRTSSNITLDNVTIVESHNGVYGYGATSLTIRDGSFSAIGYKSIYIVSSTSPYIANNTFTDGGRNFVQLDKVNGANTKIIDNTGENQLGNSSAEDFISLYKSNGTSSSPIEVARNRLRNGGASNSGSGIMTGDGGGSYQYIHDNVLVNPGQVGIGIAGGTFVNASSNKIYSASYAWTNIGIYVRNYSTGTCSDITVGYNQINWKNKSGTQNDSWNSGTCGTVADWGTNIKNAAIDASIW